MTSKVLELLENGEWHSIEEIQRKTRLSHQELKKVIDFLVKYDFVVVDEHGERIKVSEVFLKTLSHKPL
jgi:DNA-binding IclR family transcriptional regulator